MTLRASKPSFNVREKLTELAVKFGLKGSELAKAETLQDARDLVSAGRKNKIINGSMIIDQRHSGASNTNSNGYHTDRFRSQVGNADQLVQTYQQVADGPPGFTNSLKITTTTPETSVDSNEYLSVYNKMEGYDLQDLAYSTAAAKTITVSFYVKSSITGTFGFGIYRQEAAGNRMINFTYTIDNPNVWERKSITIVGDIARAISNTSTSGPWWNCWHLMAGTSYEGNLSPTWEDYSTTNWVGYEITDAVCTTNGATWQITGVQLEVGKNATDFEHRPYGEELALCQRYFQRIGGEGSGGSADYNNYIASGFTDSNGSNFYGGANLKVSMRTSPTITFDGTISTLGYTHPGLGWAANSLAAYWSCPQSYVVRISSATAGGSTGYGAYARVQNDNSQLNFSAEL